MNKNFPLEISEIEESIINEAVGSYTIKEMAETERPREKIVKFGVEKVSNRDLLSVLIRTGYEGATALDIADDIISISREGIAHLAQVTLEELTEIKGIGMSKAVQILAAIELGKRVSRYKEAKRVKVNNPETIRNLLMDELRFLKQEVFIVILLNTKNEIISEETISKGTLNSTIVHPRDVFSIAIRKNAHSVMLVHNHPSGSIDPSQEDINITKRLKEVGELVGIPVLDHIILAGQDYLSFRREGLL